jgi:aspartyl-tRNA(Asn)/glutamyl-tRNA(Gln) amidotransferase subunit A
MYLKSIKELNAGLKNGEFSSTELTNYYLKRINHYANELNCFITIDEQFALKQAKQADKAIARGGCNFLTGIPMAHKDIFCTKGIKTSCGSRMLDNFIAPYDATIVTRLNEINSVLMAKANMDEFAMGSSNENSYYGPVLNPWNINHVAGGSSGGSACAVAARLSPYTTGTDTGGSIRQPAAFCGITGLKPTYGLVSRFGMVAFASSLDQAGPMAQSAEDCAMVLNTLAGFDERDSTSVKKALPPYHQSLNKPLDGVKIGIPRNYFGEHLDAPIAQAINTAAILLEQLGAKLIDINLKTLEYSIPCYYVIASAEASSNLSRFDGLRYGHRAAGDYDLKTLYLKSRSEGFGDEVKRRILTGTYVLSAGYFDAYYVQAQKVRRLIRDEFIDTFSQVDVILGPTTPTTAFKLGEKTQDPIAMYLSDIYTIGVNLAGLPALSMPIGFIDGLPVGAHLIGKHFDESRLLNIAHRYQLESDWHKKIPQQFV